MKVGELSGWKSFNHGVAPIERPQPNSVQRSCLVSEDDPLYVHKVIGTILAYFIDDAPLAIRILGDLIVISWAGVDDGVLPKTPIDSAIAAVIAGIDYVIARKGPNAFAAIAVLNRDGSGVHSLEINLGRDVHKYVNLSCRRWRRAADVSQ